jgi:hypothetical protein
MRIIIMAIVAFLLISPMNSDAQKVVKKKTTTAKPKAKPKPQPIQEEESEQEEDAEDPLLNMGETNIYTGKAGDQLIYEVNAGGQTYELVITQRVPISEKYFYSFDWEMTAPVTKKGHIDISSSVYDAKKYINYFTSGSLTMVDTCTVWMTGSNFAEMPDKKTIMQIDDNPPATFYRKDEAEQEYTVLYRGREVKLDIFKIDNELQGKQHHQLWIQGISSFPLIVKMDLGWTIRLKEIK